MDAIQPGTFGPFVENGQNITVKNSPEMQLKMEELTRENLQLKESLEKNHTDMEEHLSKLVNRQEELAKVYEAHRLKFADTKNRLKVVEAENDELKARIDDFEKDRADQSTQTEKTDDPKPASSVATVDNNLSIELKAMTEKCEQQNQEVAHAHKIIASLKDQLESLYLNTFNPIKPEDLKSTDNIQEEPHRRQFLESFAHYNDKLRELGYCYAAQTSRYTIVQDCLHRCSEILLRTENPAPSGESRESLRSKISEDLQECRSALVGEESKTIAEREEMIRAQNEYQKIFIDYNSMIFEVESLRRETERLNCALQSAAALRDERHNKAEAAVKEKERSVDEQRRGVEKDRQDLLAQRTELQRSAEANASSLRKNESLLEEKRKALERDREVLEKEREVLEKDRELLQKDRNDFSAEKKKFAQSKQTSDQRLRARETSLNEIEEDLKEKQEKFFEQKREFERSKQQYADASANNSYSHSYGGYSGITLNPHWMNGYGNDSGGSDQRCYRCGKFH